MQHYKISCIDTITAKSKTKGHTICQMCVPPRIQLQDIMLNIHCINCSYLQMSSLPELPFTVICSYGGSGPHLKHELSLKNIYKNKSGPGPMIHDNKGYPRMLWTKWDTHQIQEYLHEVTLFSKNKSAIEKILNTIKRTYRAGVCGKWNRCVLH
jgi:hypothetical protein